MFGGVGGQKAAEERERVRWRQQTEETNSVFHFSALVDRRNKPAKTCLLNTSLSLLSGCSLNGSKSRATADGGMADGREEKDECPKATFIHCQRLLCERLQVCPAFVRGS